MGCFGTPSVVRKEIVMAWEIQSEIALANGTLALTKLNSPSNYTNMLSASYSSSFYTNRSPYPPVTSYGYDIWNGWGIKNFTDGQTKRVECVDGKYMIAGRNGSQWYVYFYSSGGTQLANIGQQYGNMRYTTSVTLIAAYDKSTSQAIITFVDYRNNNVVIVGQYYSTSWMANTYLWLNGTIPVYRHYKSVPGLFSINGNKALSVLTNDVTDTPITKLIAADKIVVSPDSCMFGYELSSMAVGDSRLIAWSGDNKCYLGKESGQYSTTDIFRLSFSFGGQPTSFSVAREYIRNNYRVWLGFVIDETNKAAQPCLLENAPESQAGYQMVVFNITDLSVLSAYYRWLTPSLNRDDRPTIPNPFVDNPQNQPAGGVDFHPRYDTPNVPQGMRVTSGINNGFAQVFAMSEQNVRELANVLWSDDFIDTIKKLFGNPADIVLGLNIFPVVPASDTAFTEIKAGNVSTGIQSHKINNRYQTFDCGSIDIKGVWDCYLDFAPNTKIELYLPFCGTHSLDTDDLMQTFTPDNTIKAGSTLSLRYVVDFLTGACVAQLMVNGSVHYQFPGSCSSSVPINSQSYLNGLTTLINTVAISLVTIATKGMSAPATAGVIGSSLASNVVNSKPEITKSGNLTGELGFLSYNAPYITITEPIQASVDAQRQFTGLPNYYVRPLNECSGFTKVADVHIEGFSCTDEEREEIENLLKDGVLI